MGCNHPRIKSVNCVIYCAECGAELPAGFVPGVDASKAAKAAETPENGVKTATRKPTRKKVQK